MSYAATAALQEAVFQHLSADATLATLVDGVYDALPTGVLPGHYVQLGPEQVRDRSDKTGHGARHEFTVTVVGQDAGFLGVKQAAARVSELLVDADLTLARGTLVTLRFRRAKAERNRSDDTRRIEMRFMAQIADS